MSSRNKKETRWGAWSDWRLDEERQVMVRTRRSDNGKKNEQLGEIPKGRAAGSGGGQGGAPALDHAPLGGFGPPQVAHGSHYSESPYNAGGAAGGSYVGQQLPRSAPTGMEYPISPSVQSSQDGSPGSQGGYYAWGQDPPTSDDMSRPKMVARSPPAAQFPLSARSPPSTTPVRYADYGGSRVSQAEGRSTTAYQEPPSPAGYQDELVDDESYMDLYEAEDYPGQYASPPAPALTPGSNVEDIYKRDQRDGGAEESQEGQEDGESQRGTPTARNPIISGGRRPDVASVPPKPTSREGDAVALSIRPRERDSRHPPNTRDNPGRRQSFAFSKKKKPPRSSSRSGQRGARNASHEQERAVPDDSDPATFPSPYAQRPPQTGSGGRSPTQEPVYSYGTVVKPPMEPEQKRLSRTSLDKDYKIYKSKEFYVGRVLKVLWTEPAGNGGNVVIETTVDSDDIFSSAQFGEKAYSSIRRFVIVKARKGHCMGLPILTYSGLGLSKNGVKVSDHTIIHMADQAPMALRDEPQSHRRPVSVEPASARDKLAIASRLNYSKLYTIEHNFKVCFIGEIHRDSEVHFFTDFEAVFRAGDAYRH